LNLIDESSYFDNKRLVTLKFSEFLEYPVQTIQPEKRLKGWSRKKRSFILKRLGRSQ